MTKKKKKKDDSEEIFYEDMEVNSADTKIHTC